MSSSILKLYKYKNVQEISKVLSEFFLETILSSTFKKNLENTLLIPVPISKSRMSERGFNQMEYITLEIGRLFKLDVSSNLIFCRNSHEHQASKNKVERYSAKENPFYIDKQKTFSIKQYSSVTLVDDVITTGSTLEKVADVIKTRYGRNTIVNALCIFRGKPYYLSSD
jgi:ComF family protein